jgi:hypothetical protein
MLGWLELPLDDAPSLVIAGFNEGRVPAHPGVDAFLTEELRRVLDLVDDRRRLARDAYALEAIRHSRPHVHLVAGRRSAEDEPLVPSRLLLSGDPQSQAEMICRFYGSDLPAARAAPPLFGAGDKCAFLVPPPQPPREPVTELSVTAFRDYIACPYRFYLKHVLKLKQLEDRAVEMDALAFGILAHDVLQAFGRSPLADSSDETEIRRFLNHQLDRAVAERYGRHPGAPTVIQQEQLRYRLDRFARWQAASRADGWQIVRERVEKDLRVAIDVDGLPFAIKGKIDRIDRHAQTGVYRVLDYKTGDGAQKPEQMHQQGPRESPDWVDLQLPLYSLLAQGVTMGSPIELGYLLLPKNVDDIGFAEADWDDTVIASAVEAAMEIVRKVRAGVFWPPREPPRYADEFAGICLDEYPDRRRIIAAVTKELMR